MTLLSFPAITDDSGDGKTGTVINKAWADAFEAEIEDKIHSTNNPTVTPADSIDKVEAAKGSLVDIDTRISVSINADGTIKDTTNLITDTIFQNSLGHGINWLLNSEFNFMSAGLTGAPDRWLVTNMTTALTGTSQSDTTRKIGNHALKCTRVSGLGFLNNIIIKTSEFALMDWVKGQKVCFGMWLKTDTASHANIQISDGTDSLESDFHTGGDGWEWITVGPYEISSGAVALYANVLQWNDGDVYVGGGVFCFSDKVPNFYFPPRTIRLSRDFHVAGALPAADDYEYFSFARPTILQNLQLYALTGPTGGAMTYEMEKREGSAWVSSLSVNIAASENHAAGQWPFGATYDHACLKGLFLQSGADGTPPGDPPAGADNALARLNITALNGSPADLFGRVDYIQQVHPLEYSVGYGFQGES